MGCSGSSKKEETTAPVKRKEIEEKLKEFEIDMEAKLEPDYRLELNLKKKRHYEFMKEIMGMKFPNIFSLNLRNVTVDNEYMVAKFLKDAIPAKLVNFAINTGDSPTYIKLSTILETRIFEHISGEVYLDGLLIDNETMQTIFTKCKGVKSLVMIN